MTEIQETHPQGDERPEQFKQIQAWLHGERERLSEVAQDWSPSPSLDSRDLRSAQLLGETLLRMQPSLGSCSQRQDILEGWNTSRSL